MTSTARIDQATCTTYDNTKVAVGQIIGGGKERKLTIAFLHLQSHYLFDYRFCRVARPNEKGKAW